MIEWRACRFSAPVSALRRAGAGAQLAAIELHPPATVAEILRLHHVSNGVKSACRPPLLNAMKLVRTTGTALSLLVCDWGAFLGSAVAGVFGPPLQALLSAARAVKEFLFPIFKVRDLVYSAC